MISRRHILKGGAVIAAGSFFPAWTRRALAEENKWRAARYGLDGKLVEFFTHEGPVNAVAYHTDGKRIISAAADKTARAWTPAIPQTPRRRSTGQKP